MLSHEFKNILRVKNCISNIEDIIRSVVHGCTVFASKSSLFMDCGNKELIITKIK